MLAIIPVKGHSTRLREKNLAPFAGASLLQIKIQQLLPHVERVIVATDTEPLAEVALRSGAQIIWREPHYSRETVDTDELLAHIIESGQIDGDIVYAICTCPLFDRFGELINTYMDGGLRGNGVLFTARLYQRHLWANEPVNWKGRMPRTQELPEWWEITHSAFVLSTKVLRRNGTLIGPKANVFPVSATEAIEIDYEDEFKLAERIFLERRS